MSLQPQQLFQLQDGKGQVLGSVVIDRVQGNLVFGQFQAGPAYAEVEPLFAEYVEAANEQILSVVGELDATIAGLGLCLRGAGEHPLPSIYDVQIGDNIITFRVRSDQDGKDDTAPSPLPSSAEGEQRVQPV